MSRISVASLGWEVKMLTGVVMHEQNPCCDQLLISAVCFALSPPDFESKINHCGT